MPPFLLALLSPRGLALSAILALGLTTCSAGLWGMHQQAQRRLAEAEVVTIKADIVRLRAEADARVAAMEEAWRLRVRRADQENALVQAQNDRRLAAARRDLDLVRARLIDALTAPVPDGADPAATYRDRAATAGALLDEALRAHAESTAAAERHAGDVRGLLDAWPGTTPAGEVTP